MEIRGFGCNQISTHALLPRCEKGTAMMVSFRGPKNKLGTEISLARSTPSQRNVQFGSFGVSNIAGVHAVKLYVLYVATGIIILWYEYYLFIGCKLFSHVNACL